MAAPPCSPTPAAAADPAQVVPRDLEHLKDIQSLLAVLNDARAGADLLARHVAQIRPLRARVEEQFRARHPTRPLPSLARLVTLIGNRALEASLLQLLEDLIVLHSEIGPLPK